MTGCSPTPEAPAAPQPLCPSDALVERGLAHVFDLRLWGQPARGFVLRFDGRLVAYVNRCAHVPAEMDWQAGEFLDQDRRWILCSIHGAAYEPSNGLCVGGPCRGKRLFALDVREADGQVTWYPSSSAEPLSAPLSAESSRPTDEPLSP